MTPTTLGIQFRAGRAAVIVGLDVQPLKVLEIVARPFRQANDDRLAILFTQRQSRRRPLVRCAKQIKDLVIVNLVVRQRHRERRHASGILGHLASATIDARQQSGNDASIVQLGAATHRMRLARARHSIRKDGHVESGKERFDIGRHCQAGSTAVLARPNLHRHTLVVEQILLRALFVHRVEAKLELLSGILGRRNPHDRRPSIDAGFGVYDALLGQFRCPEERTDARDDCNYMSSMLLTLLGAHIPRTDMLLIELDVVFAGDVNLCS